MQQCLKGAQQSLLTRVCQVPSEVLMHDCYKLTWVHAFLHPDQCYRYVDYLRLTRGMHEVSLQCAQGMHKKCERSMT